MTQFRGKLRQQYIDNWLAGNEDPEVEVIPTRVEGKYIVRERVSKQINPLNQQIPQDLPKGEEKTNIQNNISDNNPKDNNADNNVEKESPEDNSPEYEEEEDTEDIGPSLCHGLGLVLQQLQMMNDERKQAQQKKEEKKKLKAMVQKQFQKQFTYNGPVYNGIYNPYAGGYQQLSNFSESKPKEPAAGIRTRRRLNLLDRYK